MKQMSLLILFSTATTMPCTCIAMFHCAVPGFLGTDFLISNHQYYTTATWLLQT
jgi:hypothetical protein